jgi:hypothetical protein
MDERRPRRDLAVAYIVRLELDEFEPPIFTNPDVTAGTFQLASNRACTPAERVILSGFSSTTSEP